MAMMSGTPARTPMPLKIAASTRERQPPLAGMECKHRGRGPDGQVLEHGALDLLLGLLRVIDALPGEHHAADFNGPTPVALADAAFGFKDSPIAVQLDHGAAVDQPKQSQVFDAGERPLPITAKQIKRPPAESRRAPGPSAVEETAAVVDEAQPTLRRHVARRFVRIEPRERFGPSARRATVVLDDGGAFFLGVGPGVVLC